VQKPLFNFGKPGVIFFSEAKPSKLEDTFTQVAQKYRKNEFDLMFVKSSLSHWQEDWLGN